MTLRIYEGRYRYMTTNQNGTVGRWLGRKAKEIESVAKIIATEEKLVRSGRYRAGITGRLITETGGLVARIGSKARTRDGKYSLAAIIEGGSEQHFIRPNRKKALWWDMPNDRGWAVQPDDGRPVGVVLHPGTRPYKVLHRAALRVLKGGIA